ncbi:hypothetical protein CPB84DRAFT_1765011 [Gymnopilus junonius]|uniref:Uncharacterized protein n=1 Tax=Gymnopilus junonius TaxID=109634 RepID=A0A9P5TSJ4_GYMJU|nr:hypothetical protein CPB84DRAFT_1765011 [Gymnopilus junonius]
MRSTDSVESQLARDDDPRLPQDLERSIFEIAALEWPAKDACRLFLVAKRVYNWTRPFLFEVFVQYLHGPYFPNFKEYPALKLEDVGKFTRYLLLATKHDNFELDEILSSCPNVVHLDLFGEPLRKHLKAIRPMRLVRLAAILRHMLMAELLTPTFINLTHLDVIDSALDYDDDDKKDVWEDHWEVLAALPRLTHLSVSDCHYALVPHLLLHCKQLQILLVHDRKDEEIERSNIFSVLSDIKDERLVLMIEMSVELLQKELLDGKKEKAMEFWVTAELFAAARKRKFLNDTSQRFIDPDDFDWDEELNDQGKMWYSALSIGPFDRCLCRRL